ncbi:MAG: hypothetical protein HZB19_10645 [Chloroflexi bacterium]|nr:hypothetical protein [Chloroflexota bacterium]
MAGYFAGAFIFASGIAEIRARKALFTCSVVLKTFATSSSSRTTTGGPFHFSSKTIRLRFFIVKAIFGSHSLILRGLEAGVFFIIFFLLAGGGSHRNDSDYIFVSFNKTDQQQSSRREQLLVRFPSAIPARNLSKCQ